MTEVMPGARVREIRRRFVEALLSSMSKEDLLDFQEHWQVDAHQEHSTLLEEFSRYVAVVAPEQFRDTTRRLRKGDTVVVRGRCCDCKTCGPVLKPGAVLQVYSTGKEDKWIRSYNESPVQVSEWKGPIVRLADPRGGYFGCCTNESSLELAGPDAIQNVRVTTPRQPETGWVIEPAEEREEIARLVALAKRRATEPPAPRAPATGRIMYDHATKKFVVASDVPGLDDHASRIADMEDYLKLLDERLEKARLDRVEWLEGEIDRLWSRVWFLGAWALVASAIVFGLLQFVASVYGS